MLKLIEELQKDREARHVRPTYVPARTLFTECIKRFGKDYPSAYESLALVRSGEIVEHETIGGVAFSVAGTEIKYNAESVRINEQHKVL